MSISEHFARLGAPFRVVRRSWGSVRADGTVILRVWIDETGTIEGNSWVQLANHEFYRWRGRNFGYDERNDHIELNRADARCFMVMCTQKAPAHIPRKIHHFDGNELWVGGELTDGDGETWIESVGRIPVRLFARGRGSRSMTRKFISA